MTMSAWQRIRTTVHLFAAGLKRRMVIGSRLVLIDGDRVLLLRHTYMPGWHFPGGGVEPGETAAEGAFREGMEETGLAAQAPLTLLGFYLKQNEATNRDYVAVYVSRSHRREREFKPGGEIAEMGWFPMASLPAEVDPGTARRIAEITDGLVAADRW